MTYKDEAEGTADDVGVPRHVPWPASWSSLVESIRRLNPPVSLEAFAGLARMTRAMAGNGVSCATPIDAFSNPEFNLLNVGFVAVLVGILLYHLVDHSINIDLSNHAQQSSLASRLQLHTKVLPLRRSINVRASIRVSTSCHAATAV